MDDVHRGEQRLSERVQSRKVTLDMLHDDSIVKILSHLSLADLVLGARPTCRRLHRLSFHASLWRVVVISNKERFVATGASVKGLLQQESQIEGPKARGDGWNGVGYLPSNEAGERSENPPQSSGPKSGGPPDATAGDQIPKTNAASSGSAETEGHADRDHDFRLPATAGQAGVKESKEISRSAPPGISGGTQSQSNAADQDGLQQDSRQKETTAVVGSHEYEIREEREKAKSATDADVERRAEKTGVKRYLEKLEVCHSLSDELLTALDENVCPNLKELVLRNPTLGPSFFSLMGKYSFLEHLSVFFSFSTTADDLARCFDHFRSMAHLTSFTVEVPGKLNTRDENSRHTRDSIKQFFEACSSLAYISLNFDITADIVNAILSTCSHLHTLHLFRPQITPAAFDLKEERQYPPLQTLSVTADALPDECVQKIADAFPGLKRLTVSGSGMTDVGLRYLFENCSNLECIDMDNPHSASSTDSKPLQYTVASLAEVYITPGRTKLKRFSCRNFRSGVDEEFIGKLCQYNNTLKCLNLCLRADISDQCLDAVAQFCPSLEEIQLCGNLSITVSGVLNLIRQRPSLVKVDLHVRNTVLSDSVSTPGTSSEFLSNLHISDTPDLNAIQETRQKKHHSISDRDRHSNLRELDINLRKTHAWKTRDMIELVKVCPDLVLFAVSNGSSLDDAAMEVLLK